MNLRKQLLLFSVLLTLAWDQSVASIVNDLDQLITTLPPGHIHSIKVVDAQTSQVLFDRNSHFNMLPASTLKVITAIAAYHILGGKHQYRTALFRNNPLPEGGVYSGDLTIIFSGDPSFTRADLSELLGALKEKGVKIIRGNIWLDGSIFNGYSRAEGASWDDHNICYAAPVSAMILDRNCFFGWLIPVEKESHLAKMVYDEPQWSVSVDSQIETRQPKNHEANGCVQEVWPSLNHEYRLEGCIQPYARPIRMAFSVRDPEQATARFVDSFFKENDIKIEGKILLGKPKSKSKWLVAEHFSPPVPELLQQVLQKSDNIYADSLLKTIGATVSGKKGSYFSGTKAVLAMLRHQGIELSRVRLEDGSGLSRYNMLSASDFIDVLKFGWQQWGEKAPWLAVRDNDQYWFKTGNMSGVNNAVGYVFPTNGGPLIFAILLNGLRSSQTVLANNKNSLNDEIRMFHQAFLERLAR